MDLMKVKFRFTTVHLLDLNINEVTVIMLKSLVSQKTIACTSFPGYGFFPSLRATTSCDSIAADYDLKQLEAIFNNIYLVENS